MFCRCVRVATALLAMTLMAMAQNVTSSVTAILVDPSGAAVPGLTCRLTNQTTGAVHTGTSAADGSITFPAIFSGTYMFQVEGAGFRKLVINDINVTSAERRSLGTLSLQIGEVRDAVSVTAEATLSTLR